MKYLAIDIETTGLDPDVDQLLMASFILADTEDVKTPVENLPSITIAFHYDRISFSYKAYSIVTELAFMEEYKKRIQNGTTVSFDGASQSLRQFLSDNGVDIYTKHTLAGKNLMAFDIPFIDKIGMRWFKYHYRCLEPANFYTMANDTVMPNLEECCRRAGIVYDKAKAHESLYDAQLIVELIRLNIQP